MVRARIRDGVRAWRHMRRFNALGEHARSIVFYAEDAASWTHFAPIVTELTGPLQREVCYLASAPDDPVLARGDGRLHTFHIGRGLVRTALFLALRARVLVMTMPDLETFHIKRSRVQDTHYVYVFHSMVSTHMIYRPAAFDHYDTVLCVGPHHLREIRAREARYGLRPKRLIEHGYGRLDAMLSCSHQPRADNCRGQRHVLVAPSWGPNCLLETLGNELTTVLLRAGCHVTLRPHPETLRRCPDIIHRLRQECLAHPDCELQTDVADVRSMHQSDIMISDWSGAALEYAFGLERPVLFVDVPRKVNNPEYARLECEPIEAAIRQQIGQVISPENLHAVPLEIDKLCGAADAFRDRIRSVREQTVYNIGRSGPVAALHIARLADAAETRRMADHGISPATS